MFVDVCHLLVVVVVVEVYLSLCWPLVKPRLPLLPDPRSQYLQLIQSPARLSVANKHTDQRVTLNCSFIAYPAESLDVIWLVNYNHQRHHQSSADTPEGGAELQRFSGASSRLPAEERFVVLYDSKLHRLSQLAGGQSSNAAAANNSSDASSEQPVVAGSAASNDNHQQHLSEVSLYGNRLLVRETRHSASPLSATFDSAAAAAESILKESQVIIQAAHVDDSAR